MTVFDPPDPDRHDLGPDVNAPRAAGYHFSAPDPAAWAASVSPPRRSARRLSPRRRRLVAVLGVLAMVSGPAFLGYEVAQNRSTPTAASAGNTFSSPGGSSGSGGSRSLGGGSGQSTPDQLTLPSGGAPSGSRTSVGRLDVSSVSQKVDDSIVNVWVTTDSGEAAGTGIVVSASGLVITNNHVIADSRDVQVESIANGQTHPAKVLGYSLTGDIALLQVQGAANFEPADLGDSGSVAVGDPVVALGNAGGQGGLPAVVSGSITGKNRQIIASEEDGSNVQTLTGLIETSANIQPGDSGGPLADASGRVIGVIAAGSSSNSAFGTAGNQGYAIPIENALAIANKILAGTPGPDLHVGSNRGVLGVQVSGGATGGRSTGSGAAVLGTDPAGAAAKAGIVTGDTVVAVDGRSVASGSELTLALVPYGPGDKVEITWVDRSGTTHRATVSLGSGPPA